MAQDDFINAPCMWRYLLFTHCTHSLLWGLSISIIWRKNTSSALKTFRFLSQRYESYRTSYWYLTPLKSLVGGKVSPDLASGGSPKRHVEGPVRRELLQYGEKALHELGSPAIFVTQCLMSSHHKVGCEWIYIITWYRVPPCLHE